MSAAGTDDDQDEGDDDFDRDQCEQLALQRTITKNSVIQADKPRGELLLVITEEVAVLAVLGLHVASLLTGAGGSLVVDIAGIAVWSYIAIIASMRLLFSTTSRFSYPKLWYHTAFLYALQWLFAVLVFRSAIIHPRNPVGQAVTISGFALVTLLGFIALTSRKGNNTVELEYEDNLEPSKEQTASIFSLATFSWVDAIVWRGYRKTYELADVWNLAPKDKAAAILADYRQVKKTSSLALHLLKYFKRGLIIQAAWACFSGFLTFAPTLLLKAILEYVETPDVTPRNAAWFYVILLFISGCAAALADGQALWMGRKICIRLRAVIIGEIYAKALKRKISAGGERVLGEKKTNDVVKKSAVRKALTWSRKKKSRDTKPDEDTANANPAEAVSSGTIINLMAVDSFKVAEICAYLHFLWANTPVQVILAVVLLYRIMGYSSIAGLGMMAILLPVNLYISGKFASIQKKILAATDKRIHNTNEVLTNIRIIKFFAWEDRFMHNVNETRKVEMKHLRTRYILWGTAATVWTGAPILITFLSFLVYTVVEKKALIPSVAFTALSLFQILRIPLDQLADMVAHVQESKVSVDRIEEYLSEEETEKYKQLKNCQEQDDGEPLIGFEKATFSYGSRHEDLQAEGATPAFRMHELDMRFHVGQLNVIVGPTGCGKTSLLMALLGEMTKLEGHVYLPGGRSREDMQPNLETGLTESVAYCAQQAWLVNATIKDNIVFASPWNAKRYKEVIAACSLEKDLEILDGGDETLVGEKGVTLSGGQKQRISLARALYCNARHILLDDILSAVDSHTAKWIFERALMGPLMYNRTCILVTHNAGLCLPYAHFAVVLDNGRVVAQGSANEIISSGKLSEDLTKSRSGSTGPSRVPSRAPSDHEADGGMAAANGSVKLDGAANGRTNGDTKKRKRSGPPGEDPKPSTHSTKETKAVGRVKYNVIVLYLKAMGPWYYWLCTAIVFAGSQLSSVSTNVWIRTWANAYASRETALEDARSHTTPAAVMQSSYSRHAFSLPFLTSFSSTPQSSPAVDEVNPGYYLGIYGLLGVLYMVVTLTREGFLFGGSLAASRKIHQRLMESVMRARFRFFDSTPLGQIMNRFSKDIEAIDQEVAPVAIGVVHCLASIITIIILVSIITPGFLIAGTFISIIYFFIGKFYINSSVDLKRLESVQRSPLYQQFGETLSGMTTIRAYADERRFIRDNLNQVNTHNRPFIYLWATNRWLAFRVDVTGALVSFFAGVFVVLSVGKIDAGAAGLAMTYAVTFTENVLWFVRLYSANEQNMNSVERIKEYLDVEQEAKPFVAENRPPANWPSHGAVEFIGYSTRYRTDFDFVLKGITLKIGAGEKVGVVGRTGAGKSSLALALFRALEAEEGKILIDDVDIGLIGLQDLRESIVMVPQGESLLRFRGRHVGILTSRKTRRCSLVQSAATSTLSTFSPMKRSSLPCAARSSSVASSQPRPLHPCGPAPPLRTLPPHLTRKRTRTSSAICPIKSPSLGAI